jgi:hypothetical protein
MIFAPAPLGARQAAPEHRRLSRALTTLHADDKDDDEQEWNLR